MPGRVEKVAFCLTVLGVVSINAIVYGSCLRIWLTSPPNPGNSRTTPEFVLPGNEVRLVIGQSTSSGVVSVGHNFSVTPEPLVVDGEEIAWLQEVAGEFYDEKDGTYRVIMPGRRMPTGLFRGASAATTYHDVEFEFRIARDPRISGRELAVRVEDHLEDREHRRTFLVALPRAVADYKASRDRLERFGAMSCMTVLFTGLAMFPLLAWGTRFSDRVRFFLPGT